MNYIRIIPVLYFKFGKLVKSFQFKNHHKIGSIITQTNRFKEWDIDEIVLIDITHQTVTDKKKYIKGSGTHFFDFMPKIAKNFFTPISLGGGIKSINDIRNYLRVGADRVILGSGIFEDPNLISDASKTFGSQAIIVSIDIKRNGSSYLVTKNNGNELVQCKLEEFIHKVCDNGAGEILINDIDRDGTNSGLDQRLIKKITKFSSVPVIIAGGASKVRDFELAIQSGVNGVCAGNYFMFKEIKYQLLKNKLIKIGLNLRKSKLGLDYKKEIESEFYSFKVDHIFSKLEKNLNEITR